MHAIDELLLSHREDVQLPPRQKIIRGPKRWDSVRALNSLAVRSRVITLASHLPIAHEPQTYQKTVRDSFSWPK